jgi:hypothetical protein
LLSPLRLQSGPPLALGIVVAAAFIVVETVALAFSTGWVLCTHPRVLSARDDQVTTTLQAFRLDEAISDGQDLISR